MGVWLGSFGRAYIRWGALPAWQPCTPSPSNAFTYKPTSRAESLLKFRSSLFPPFFGGHAPFWGAKVCTCCHCFLGDPGSPRGISGGYRGSDHAHLSDRTLRVEIRCPKCRLHSKLRDGLFPMAWYWYVVPFCRRKKTPRGLRNHSHTCGAKRTMAIDLGLVFGICFVLCVVGFGICKRYLPHAHAAFPNSCRRLRF